MKKLLKKNDLTFVEKSIADPAGRVFFYEGRILRAVFDEITAEMYIDFLNKNWINEVFDSGLIKTWICDDLKIEGVPLILEHEKVSFDLHPSEYSSYMFWIATKQVVSVSLTLSKYGYHLKDGHPWNLMFQKGQPKFIDFGSIVQADKVSQHWVHEFRKYFAVPVWLASTRWNSLAKEYRREHTHGFGLDFFEKVRLGRILLNSYDRLAKNDNKPSIFFSKLAEWVDSHPPRAAKKEYWSDYEQLHNTEDPQKSVIPKQRFVFDILKKERPKKVLDCASNKGYYAEMAAGLGASVIAFDYEEFCVDACFRTARDKKLDITPALMDFGRPTPNYGMGLAGKSSFERFESDIVLALGICHHLCITQRLLVKAFCEICMKYADKGIIFGYVDPADKHVAAWNAKIPQDYSLDSFIRYFSNKFPKLSHIENIDNDGSRRSLVYLHR